MTETSDEMHPHLRPGGGERGPNEPTSDDVDAQPPGLYVDEKTGPVPEPNEPA